MDINKLLKLANIFEKTAQGCILGPGQSTMNMDEAKNMAQAALNALSQIDESLLYSYPHENFKSVMEQLVNGEKPSSNEIQMAINEASRTGLGAFPQIGQLLPSIKRINCIM